jgi:hypothetical protein
MDLKSKQPKCSTAIYIHETQLQHITIQNLGCSGSVSELSLYKDQLPIKKQKSKNVGGQKSSK